MLNTINDVEGLLPCGDNENGLPYSVSCWKIKCNTDKDSAIREDLITIRYNGGRDDDAGELIATIRKK